ncbi:MAG: beta-phosphoglucomutase [Anaerolinea sp.]|nr:beta-phosphoglucomutase [Anaerolinea sp.]
MNEVAQDGFIHNRPSAILWDVDGVLLDTADEHYQSWVETLAIHGVNFSRQHFDRVYGMNNQSTIETLYGSDVSPQLVSQISEQKEEAYRKEIRGRVQLLPGVREWLERFTTAGIPQAVASSGPMENILAILEEARIRAHFATIVSAVGHPGKPDPWVFLEAVRQLNVDSCRVVVIEDSAAGVLAAHRAGLRCIAVSSTLTPQDSKTANLLVDRLDFVGFQDIELLLD